MIFGVDDIFLMLVPEANVKKNTQNDQNRHQHLIVVTNTLRLQHQCD